MPIYRPLIPTGTVNLDEDYQNLQDNFNQANVVYGTDHYPLDNAVAGQEGFHDKVTMPVRADPTSIAGQGIVYTKDSAIQPGRSDLYYAYQTNVGTPYSGTFFPLNACKAFGLATTGGNLIAGTSFNVTSAVFAGNAWTITLTSAAHSDATKIMVIATPVSSSSDPGKIGVQVSNTTTIIIRRSAADVSGISFWVVAL